MGKKGTDKPPAFLFYVDDFTSDGVVEAMTTEEVGAYCLLLCKAWKEDATGTIPNDDEVLARWTRMTIKRWLQCRERVLRAFTLQDDGRWHQKRMKHEFSKYRQYKKKRHASAKVAADARWMRHACESHSERNAVAMRKHANQSQTQVKSNINGQSQTQDKPSIAAPLEFDLDLDLKAVDGAEWIREFSDYRRHLPATNEDPRFLAQLAWLVCAGVPILSNIHDALDGIAVLARDGRKPDKPIAYLRSCLTDSIGGQLEKYIALAPKRRECAHITEGE